MSTLYLDRKGLEIRTEPGILVLYEEGRRVRTVPLVMLERLVIEARTGLDSKLLLDLAAAKVSLTILGGGRGRRSVLLPGVAHSDARIRLGQYALLQDPRRRHLEASVILRRKVRTQAAALCWWARRQPRQAHELARGIQSLRGILKSWPLDADADADAADLLGLEGAAAVQYFRAMTVLFPASLNFIGRNRRPPRDAVNAALSYGYTLLHAEAAREAQAAGLDPMLGFLHRPAWGRESLAADLMEPLRPRIDLWVWGLFHDRTLRDAHFALVKGACLLQKAGRREFFEAYEAAVPLWRRRLREDCRKLVRRIRSVPGFTGLESASDEPDGEE